MAEIPGFRLAEPNRRKDCTPHHNIFTRVFNKEKPGNHKVCRVLGQCGKVLKVPSHEGRLQARCGGNRHSLR